VPKTVIGRQGEDPLGLTVNFEVAQRGCERRTGQEAEKGVTHNLLQCKVQEEDSTMVYGEIIEG
jgi:hypothetical protein